MTQAPIAEIERLARAGTVALCLGDDAPAADFPQWQEDLTALMVYCAFDTMRALKILGHAMKGEMNLIIARSGEKTNSEEETH